MPSTERAVLVITLRVAIVFFGLKLVMQLPWIIQILYSIAANELTAKSAIALFISIVSYVLLVWAAFYVWFFPSILLSKPRQEDERAVTWNIDVQLILAGALAVMGIYFIVSATDTFIRNLYGLPIILKQLYPEVSNFGSRGSWAYVLQFAADLLVFGLGYLLLSRRKTIAMRILKD